MHFTTAALASIVGAASAKTIRIDAGEGGLKFEPANTKAEMGDMLEFHFYPQKHSVVQGNPDMPCQPVEEGGFFSDFHPTMDGEAKMMFTVMVNSTDPMFYYCSAAMHCQNGMVGAVNAEDSALEKYMSDAANADKNVSPDMVFGGTVSEASNSDSDDDDNDNDSDNDESTMSNTMSMTDSMSMTPTMSSGGGGADMTSSSGGMGGGSATNTDMPAETDAGGAAAGLRGSVVGALAGAVGAAALML